MEKFYKIYYGENENDYIKRYLKEHHKNECGYLMESKAFDLFFDNMLICNEYIKYRFEHLAELVSNYNEEEDYYIDEYQFFIVEPTFGEEITIKAIERMGNTLYYDNELDLYIMGVTDLGTSRTIVPTDIEVYEVDENE